MTRPKSAAPSAAAPAGTAPPPPAGPSVLASVAPTLGLPPKGRLEWPQLLSWLHEDGWIGADDAERVAARFRAGASSLHALVRLGAAGLSHQHSGQLLDTEALTEWLAGRCGLPYLRIDPLRVDVGRVADVMSVQYAELRRALPVTVSATEVTIATAEPFDIGWVAEIETHTRRHVRLVVANPDEVRRYTTEFYALARNVRAAQKSGENAA
ncbi:MAG: type II/IV secretion system protein, partial [Rubrivivax sp.]|nr:type II/IV secretion system protein [Rubrivivax sp.]